MRAITVQQPWAWAIIHGGKLVENRTRIGTWRPAVGQRIAIHAGKRWSDRGADFDPLQRAYASWLGFEHWDGRYGGRTAMPIDPEGDERDALLIDFGAVIGTVEVVDVHPDAGCCKPWGESSYTEAGGTKRVDIVHLVLENPVACDPIPWRGNQGLLTLPDDIAAALG